MGLTPGVGLGLPLPWSGCSGDRLTCCTLLDQLAVVAEPVLVELLPQLAHAAGGQAELLAQLRRPVAQGHLDGNPAVAVPQRSQPVGEVNPERRLVIGRALGVVVEGLVEDVAVERTAKRKKAQGEPVTPLGT